MTNQKKTDYICISKESEGPAPDTLDETLPVLRSEAFLGAARVLLEGHVEMPVHLSEHGRSFLSSLDEKQVAIDGKKLRGTSPRITWSRDDYILRRT